MKEMIAAGRGCESLIGSDYYHLGYSFSVAMAPIKLPIAASFKRDSASAMQSAGLFCGRESIAGSQVPGLGSEHCASQQHCCPNLFCTVHRQAEDIGMRLAPGLPKDIGISNTVRFTNTVPECPTRILPKVLLSAE